MLRSMRLALFGLLLAVGTLGLTGFAADATAAEPMSASIDSCWTCNFVGTFVVVGDAAAKSIYSVVAEPMGSFITYIFLIWIALQAVKLFFPFDDAGGILKSIVLRSLVFMVVLMAFSESGRSLYFDWIYEQAIYFGSSVATEILAKVSGFGGQSAGALFEDASGNFRLLVSAPSIPSGLTAIDPGLITGMLRMIESVQNLAYFVFDCALEAGRVITLGSFFTSFGTKLMSVIASLLLFVVYGIILFSFPFYVVDLFFRLMILSSMAPLLIGSFLMGPTRGYAKAALKGIVQSALVLLTAAIVFSLAAAIIMAVPGAFSSQSGETINNFVELRAYLASRSAGFSLLDTGFWLLLMAGFFVNVAMSKSKAIVGGIIGGFNDGPSMGDKVAGMGQAIGGKAVMLGTTAAIGVAGLATSIVGVGGVGAAAGLLKGTGAAAGAIKGGLVGGKTGMGMVKVMTKAAAYRQSLNPNILNP